MDLCAVRRARDEPVAEEVVERVGGAVDAAQERPLAEDRGGPLRVAAPEDRERRRGKRAVLGEGRERRVARGFALGERGDRDADRPLRERVRARRRGGRGVLEGPGDRARREAAAPQRAARELDRLRERAVFFDAPAGGEPRRRGPRTSGLAPVAATIRSASGVGISPATKARSARPSSGAIASSATTATPSRPASAHSGSRHVARTRDRGPRRRRRSATSSDAHTSSRTARHARGRAYARMASRTYTREAAVRGASSPFPPAVRRRSRCRRGRRQRGGRRRAEEPAGDLAEERAPRARADRDPRDAVDVRAPARPDRRRRDDGLSVAAAARDGDDSRRAERPADRRGRRVARHRARRRGRKALVPPRERGAHLARGAVVGIEIRGDVRRVATSVLEERGLDRRDLELRGARYRVSRGRVRDRVPRAAAADRRESVLDLPDRERRVVVVAMPRARDTELGVEALDAPRRRCRRCAGPHRVPAAS